MVGNKCNVSVKDYFRRKNIKKGLQDPTNDFSIIPSWNKEFVCLIGLEEVVQFRLERLEKTVYTAPNKHGTRGRPKKFPIPAVVPATLNKDPYTCAKCNTDVSCSWKHDVNSSVLCHSCLKCSWRIDHWPSSELTETIIKSISDNPSIHTSYSKPVWNEPQPMKEAFFPLQHSSHSIPQECDQQVPKNSLCSSSNFHPDSPFYCSSPLSSDLSSDLSSSPPGFHSDTSSHWSSSFSSDHCFSCIYLSSPSCGSSLCDGSSPSYLPSYSDLNSSSSSMTPSPSGSPPKDSSKWVSQKVKTPYWMETSLAKALLKDDKVVQETKKETEEQSTRNKSQCKEEKTGKMAALSVPSSSSNQWILPETQSALPDSVPSSSPMLSVSKHQFQTQMLTPNLQKTTIAEKNKLTMEEGLKPGHGNLQKVTPNVLRGYVSSTKSESSTYTSDSGKSKSTVRSLPTTWLAVSGKVRQQDSGSIPRCFDDNKKESVVKNKKFGTKVQESHAHPSSSQISSAPTHASFLSRTVLSTNQGKTNRQEKVNWGAAPKKKIEKWIRKPKTSMRSHSSYPSCSSSSLFGQPEKVNQQVLVSPKMKMYPSKFRSNPNGKPCDPK